ncbi:hypothetical protein D3C84_1149980 [compost metagenome]
MVERSDTHHSCVRLPINLRTEASFCLVAAMEVIYRSLMGIAALSLRGPPSYGAIAYAFSARKNRTADTQTPARGRRF